MHTDPPTDHRPSHPLDCPWEFGEAAEFLRVSVRHLQRLADAGQIFTIRLGRRRLIPDSEILRLAKAGC